MAQSTHNQDRSDEVAWEMSARVRRILVALDLTPLSDRVVGRLALLPLAEGARLTLLHVVPGSLPLRARRRAERDGKKALAEQAKSLKETLPKSVTVEHVVAVGAPATEIAAYASSTRAELIVMGRGGGRALRSAFLGSTAERVIRRGQLPVLVVRLPARAPYSRPAVALDLDQTAHDVLAFLLRVIPPPRPGMKIIHAFDVPHSVLVYPSLPDEDADDFRESYREKAARELESIVTTALKKARAPLHDVRWKIVVRHGRPRIAIPKAVRDAEADLLALGTHGRAGLAHVFLGTVAGDLLRNVTSDVLVVPPRADASR
ncbi:MAG: universal stress protein [Patescibacteria group bacterium]